MNLSSLLKPEAVKVIGSLTSKKRLLQELSDTVASCYGIDPTVALEALQDRESIGPTGVGDGVALPHARLDCIDSVKGAFLRLERPLEFNSIDKQPVDLVFALFAPDGESGVKHLKALAAVSRAMRDPAIRSKLRQNDDPGILYAILTDAQESKAA